MLDGLDGEAFMCMRSALVVAAFLATSTTGSAQVAGTIHGTVVDESKAALTGVDVVAIEQATGRRYHATADSRGEFRLVNVAAGIYQIEASLQGFASVTIPSIELLVGLNVQLPII